MSNNADVEPFGAYLERWALTVDGDPIVTRSSRLLPVRQGGQPAMLKLATVEEERAAGSLMAWWNGWGAAPVLGQDADAVLLERATGPQTLSAMACAADDDAATRIICRVVQQLHAPRPTPAPATVPLAVWFEALEAAAQAAGGLFAAALITARSLLAAPDGCVVLHGDIHHDNILDFGRRGWLAIDPKGLHGERGYDYANLFRNPDAATALRPDRFDRRVAIVCQAAGLEPARLLRWVLAVMGLSAAWHIQDAAPRAGTLAVAELALNRLSPGR